MCTSTTQPRRLRVMRTPASLTLQTVMLKWCKCSDLLFCFVLPWPTFHLLLVIVGAISYLYIKPIYVQLYSFLTDKCSCFADGFPQARKAPTHNRPKKSSSTNYHRPRFLQCRHNKMEKSLQRLQEKVPAIQKYPSMSRWAKTSVYQFRCENEALIDDESWQ